MDFFHSWALILEFLGPKLGSNLGEIGGNGPPSQSSSLAGPEPLEGKKREKVLRYAKDRTGKALDLFLQHIPLSSRKKVPAVPPEIGKSAARGTTAGSATWALRSARWHSEIGPFGEAAGALFGATVRILPGEVKNWFLGLRDRGLQGQIEGFVGQNCTGPLLDQEILQVETTEPGRWGENFNVRTSRTAREVTAVFSKDDASLEVVVKFPGSFPLGDAEVSCPKKIGVGDSLLRKWLLSMASFLRNRKGSVSEAVLVWKQNVEKGFEGVEECPICYSVILSANGSIPKLPCKTCKYKFHSDCLYKWFKSSHKSTCPLCQTPF